MAQPKNLVASMQDAQRRAADMVGDSLDEELVDDEETQGGSQAQPNQVAAQGAGADAQPAAPASQETVTSQPSAAPVDLSTGGQVDAQPAAPGGAAPQISDEFVDIEVDDGDTGETFVVRAKKDQAEKVKGGYLRRSTMDKKLGSLGKNRATIEKLLESGRFDVIAPYIEYAMNDAETANIMAEAISRRQQGKSVRLSDEVLDAARAAGAASVTGAAPQTAEDLSKLIDIDKIDLGDVDEYTASGIRTALKQGIQPALGTVIARLNAAEAWRADQERARQATQSEYEQRNQITQAMNAVANATRAELVNQFPDVYNGPKATEALSRLHDYASNGGYFQRIGFNPGAYIAAHYAMMSEMGAYGTNKPSTAAQTLDQIEAEGRQLAAQATRDVALRSSNGGAAPATTKPKPKEIQRFREVNGKKVPLSPMELARALGS